MVIGSDLVDGADGHTGAQYINAAYHIPAAVGVNKAEMKAGGTIRVVHRKTIKQGEEILMAYHSGYWNRWRPADILPRGRPKKRQHNEGEQEPGGADGGCRAATSSGGASSGTAAGGDAAASGGAEGRTTAGCAIAASSSEQTAIVELEESGGRRIGEACASTARSQGDGRGRGRPRARDKAAEPGSALGKRNVRSTRWNAVSRNVYQQVQQGCRRNRYERGEGGGVT